MTRLYVGGLPADISTADIAQRFKPFGNVVSCELIPAKEIEAGSHLQGVCRGFAYVQLEENDDAALRRCLSLYNHSKWRGHVLRVEVAKPRFDVKLASEWSEDAAQAAAGNQPLEEMQHMDTSIPLTLVVSHSRRRKSKIIRVDLRDGPKPNKKGSFPLVPSKPLPSMDWEYGGTPHSRVYLLNELIDNPPEPIVRTSEPEPELVLALDGEKEPHGPKAIPHMYEAPPKPQIPLSKEKVSYMKVIKAIKNATEKEEAAAMAAAAAAAARAAAGKSGRGAKQATSKAKAGAGALPSLTARGTGHKGGAGDVLEEEGVLDFGGDEEGDGWDAAGAAAGSVAGAAPGDLDRFGPSSDEDDDRPTARKPITKPIPVQPKATVAAARKPQAAEGVAGKQAAPQPAVLPPITPASRAVAPKPASGATPKIVAKADATPAQRQPQSPASKHTTGQKRKQVEDVMKAPIEPLKQHAPMVPAAPPAAGGLQGLDRFGSDSEEVFMDVDSEDEQPAAKQTAAKQGKATPAKPDLFATLKAAAPAAPAAPAGTPKAATAAKPAAKQVRASTAAAPTSQPAVRGVEGGKDLGSGKVGADSDGVDNQLAAAGWSGAPDGGKTDAVVAAPMAGISSKPGGRVAQQQSAAPRTPAPSKAAPLLPSRPLTAPPAGRRPAVDLSRFGGDSDDGEEHFMDAPDSDDERQPVPSKTKSVPKLKPPQQQPRQQQPQQQQPLLASTRLAATVGSAQLPVQAVVSPPQQAVVSPPQQAVVSPPQQALQGAELQESVRAVDTRKEQVQQHKTPLSASQQQQAALRQRRAQKQQAAPVAATKQAQAAFTFGFSLADITAPAPAPIPTPASTNVVATASAPAPAPAHAPAKPQPAMGSTRGAVTPKPRAAAAPAAAITPSQMSPAAQSASPMQAAAPDTAPPALRQAVAAAATAKTPAAAPATAPRLTSHQPAVSPSPGLPAALAGAFKFVRNKSAEEVQAQWQATREQLAQGMKRQERAVVKQTQAKKPRR